MKEFINVAFPWIVMGLLMAFCFAMSSKSERYKIDKLDNKRNEQEK